MVFESIVVEILNRALGDYVENLDRNQLKIGIWGGDVILNNLILKQNALEDLNLPVQTVYGRLGKLVLKIPWKNLYGAPVIAEVEKLYLLVIPNQEVKYNQEKEDRIYQENKQAELKRIDDAKKQEAEQGKQKPDDTFVEKLTTQIIKNVQVRIKDIHVRYEDKLTNPNGPFALGITLDNLSVETTDENWKPAILSQAVSKIFKVCSLDSLAIYWNSSTVMYSNLPAQEIMVNFEKDIANKERKPMNFTYMLGPINSSARLRLNPKPENDTEIFSIPKILLNLEMEKLAIGITKLQYQDIMLMAESMERMTRGLPYRKYRPFVPYRGHYHDWWKFAYTCILEEDVRRKRRNWDWTHISEHRKLCQSYAEIYQSKLTTKKISNELKSKLDEHEKKLDVLNLVLIRQRIELEVARIEKKIEETQKNKSWFSGWWGSNASQDELDLKKGTDIMKKFEEAMTPDEKSKLFKAIDYQENSAPAVYPKDYISMSCAFALQCLEIEIKDNSHETIRVISTELKNVKCMLQQRPAANALKVGVKIDQFSVFGLQQNDRIPKLVSSDDLPDGSALLDVLFETNPLDETCGQRLHITAQPLEIIYDAQTIIKMIETFKTPQSLALSQLQAAAGSRIADFKETSATGLQHIIHQHTSLDMKINFAAPLIIVPHGGIYSDKKSLVVVNLGRLMISSVPRSTNAPDISKLYRSGTSEDQIMLEMISQSYEKFSFELTNMQVLIVKPDENWKDCIDKNIISPMHLLQPLSLNIDIQKCMITDDPRLPKMKITAQLPSVSLSISDDRLFAFTELFYSIPFPTDDIDPAPLKQSLSKSSNLSTLFNFDSQEKIKKLGKQKEVQIENFIQVTDLDIKFIMKELSISVSRQKNENFCEKLLKFHALSLELDMIQQTYNMNVIVRLGGIGLTQFRKNNLIEIISTPMTSGHDEYLFTVEFIQVNKKSPEFHSKYQSCEQRLVLYFTTLRLQLHQEGLENLLEFSNNLQNSFENLAKKKANVDRIASTTDTMKLSVIPEEFTAVKIMKTTNRKKQRILIETIIFKLTANMKELEIIIANDACKLASLAIQGVKSEVIVKKSYTQISAILSNFTVLDGSTTTKYQEILSVINKDDALNAQIVMYNIDKEVDTDSNDMKILVKVGCWRIIFLNCFVTKMLDFLNKFQTAQQAIIDASAAAAETAKQNMKNAYENSSRIFLDVKMKAPDIIIPANSHSYNAIILKLGYLTVMNRFIKLEEQNELGDAPVIDDLKLHLENFELMRVKLNETCEIVSFCTLLLPISFGLRVKRNLSASWYNNIPNLYIAGGIKSIELNLNELDYQMVMQVLNENLSEGASQQVKLEKIEEKVIVEKTEDLEPVQKKSDKLEVEAEKSPGQTHTFLKFTFTMESFVINLFTKGKKSSMQNNHSPDNGLAKITLHVLSVKGRILSDGSIITSVLLVDCLLDDARSGREGKLIRFMERKEDTNDDVYSLSDSIASDSSSVTRSMIDITFQQKKTDMFVDIRVCSFNLVLSTDYLMKIAAFFSLPETEIQEESVALVKSTTNIKTIKSAQSITIKKSSSDESTKSNTTITINFKVEKPDIILVERMDNIDTNALILNSEVLLNLRLVGANQFIRGTIRDLQLYTCCYNPQKRQETKCPVLQPCSINVVGTTPDDEGLHLEVCISNIQLSVSPATIELLNRVYTTMSTSDIALTEESVSSAEYVDIWNPKQYKDGEFWFLKTEMGQDVMEDLNFEMCRSKKVIKEFCNISVPSVVISLETGIGNKTLPMFQLETKFEAFIHDWSSKMYVDSFLTIQMAYYNSRFAVWEPFIEPVEILENDKIVFTPWKLKLEVKMNDTEEVVMTPSSDSEMIEELPFKSPQMSINLHSDVNLELVVTKTCLQVLSDLGNAFSTAMKEGVVSKVDNIFPYKVVNESGLKITLLLEDAIFEVCNKEQDYEDCTEVLLEDGAEIALQIKQNAKSTMNIPFGKSMVLFKSNADEDILLINVNDMNCRLSLPVKRADKRYFPLKHRGENNDNWGLISEVSVQGAETIITLRSILQIHNHFARPVIVYYMTNRGNEIECIKKVPPGAFINLPLNSVYTLTNELFFSVEGYSVTAVPYVWKDLQLNLSMAKVLQCPSGKTHQSEPFIMKVYGEVEQVFFEKTSRHTMSSTCYNIHLRPAITLQNCLPIPVVCIMQGDVTEFTIQSGDKLHMPIVNPGHSYIVLKLINYLEKEWSCRHDILANPPQFSVWSFDSHDSVTKMTLDLGIHCENKQGSMILSLYCPFWMLNKTGLMLSYRKSRKCDKNDTFGSPSKNSEDNLNVLHHPENFKGPILFSFPSKNFFGKKKASIRVENGEWSDKFSIDVSGSSGMVVCKSQNRIYQIGVNNQLTYNNLTKQIMFTPYFVLINNAPFAIECQELDRPADPWIKVESNSCSPFWPRSERDDKLLKLKVSETHQITSPFLITEVHTTLLKLPNEHGGVNVDVQITEGAVYITFMDYKPGLAPALIINHTTEIISLWEKESIVIKRLHPQTQMLFSWDNPAGPRLLLWESGKKKEIEDDLRKDGLGQFQLKENENIYWVSFLDGMQRILLFTVDMNIARDAQFSGDLEDIQQEIKVSIHGLGISFINNLIRQEIMYIGIASSGTIWETCKFSSKRFKQLSLKDCSMIEIAYQGYLNESPDEYTSTVIDIRTEVDFKNGLMLRPHKKKLRRTFQDGLWFQMKTSPNQLQLHAKVNRLQIDNQMYDSIFPVVLAPVPPPKSVAATSALKPFAELSIVKRIMKHSTVQQFKYFKVLIQEFHIKVDLGFVNAIVAVLEPKEVSEHDYKQLFEKDLSLVDEPLLSHVSTQSLQEQKNFYDLLHFSPLKIHVSFSLQNQQAGAVESSTPAFINVLLQGLGVTLTDMQDVIFRLGYFERNYIFLTQKQLVSAATSHYVGQTVKQLYVLVLGLDVIGNPYGLVLGLTKGVEDLFYEPFQGAIQGPGEFAEGLVLGVRSLFGHTVGGAAGAVSRITGAMGKGIAALTFDKDYQRKRRDQINKRPANLQEGIARGGKGLVMGVVDGVTGVFTKPISGAKEQGVEGFFKGLGKGAVGLVTRPTAGVIDFASGSLDAVKRAAELSDEITRLRPPRFIHADSHIRPYVKLEAEGNKLLVELEKGKYANTDIYSYHIWIIEGKDILLLTDKRLAYVVHNDLFGGWQVDWSYTWSDIQVPAKVVDRGVGITTGEPKKKVLGLFGSGDSGKIILIADPELREIVKDKIETLRNNP